MTPATEALVERPQTAWACVNRYGGVANDTIRAYRRDSIKEFERDMPRNWRWWTRNRGWSCRRITITVSPPPAGEE